MPAFNDFPYRAAAALAITLMNESSNLDESKAIDIAWQAFKSFGDAKFQVEKYSDEVKAAILGIRAGRLERIETSPGVLQKARELLGKS